MTDINHVILIGNLTRDVGDGYSVLSNGQAKASISIAVNRSKKSGDQWVDETSYFDITVWGKTAENLRPYFVKGQKIAVEGYLKQDRWEKDGQKFSKVSVVANSVQLLGGKKQDGEKNNNIEPTHHVPFENNQSFSTSESFPEDIIF